MQMFTPTTMKYCCHHKTGVTKYTEKLCVFYKILMQLLKPQVLYAHQKPTQARISRTECISDEALPKQHISGIRVCGQLSNPINFDTCQIGWPFTQHFLRLNSPAWFCHQMNCQQLVLWYIMKVSRQIPFTEPVKATHLWWPRTDRICHLLQQNTSLLCTWWYLYVKVLLSVYAHFVVLSMVSSNTKSTHLGWLPRDQW